MMTVQSNQARKKNFATNVKPVLRIRESDLVIIDSIDLASICVFVSS